MRKRKDISIILLLAAGLFAGCSHSNEPELKNEIAVKTGVTGLQKRVASINNNTDLQAQDIKIDAYFHDTEEPFIEGAKLHYDDSEWKFWDDEHDTQIHYYWPIEGSVYTPGVGDPIVVSSLDFVGYCPYNKPAYISEGPTYNHSTGVTFTCNLSSYMTNTAQSTVSEFMLDTAYNRTSAGGAVPMEFMHPFAIIKFVVASGSDTHVTIDSIGISGLKTTGTCTYNAGSLAWSSQAGSAAMSQDGLSLKYGGSAETLPFLVIPYNYGTLTLSVKATWDDWSLVTKVVSASVNFNWEKGHSYTYNLTLEKYALKVETESTYTEQW